MKGYGQGKREDVTGRTAPAAASRDQTEAPLHLEPLALQDTLRELRRRLAAVETWARSQGWTG